jgi:hypothetical protein
MDAFDTTQPLNSEPDPVPADGRARSGHTGRTGRTGRAGRWAAGVALAAILVGGGIAVGADLASGQPSAPLSASLASGGQDASIPGQAFSFGALTTTSVAHLPGGAHVRHAFAGLRRCVAAARQLRAAGRLAAARATLRSCLRRYLRLRLLLLGVLHGQLTLKTRIGFRTIAFERGIVQTVTSSTVVVKTADQVTMTWNLTGKTAVIRARHKVGTGALAAGEQVFVIGPVVSGADDARLIVIRR